MRFFVIVVVVVMVVPMPMPMVMPMIVVGVHVRAGGDAVVAAISTGGQAEMTAFAQPGRAHGAGPGPDRAVLQPAADRVMLVVVAIVMIVIVVVVVMIVVLDRGQPGNAVVAGVAQQAIDVDHPVSVDAVQAEHAGTLVVDGVAADFGATAERRFGQVAGDAAVGHVDRATDGAAAEQQGRRAFQYLDLVGEEGFHAGSVVGTDGRGVQGAQAGGEHLHARAVQATQDWAADAGAEVGGLHTGQLLHGLAQGCGLGAVQGFVPQHFHRAGQRFRVAGQWRGGDLDRGQVGRIMGEDGHGGGGAGHGQRNGEGAMQGGAGWGAHVGRRTPQGKDDGSLEML